MYCAFTVSNEISVNDLYLKQKIWCVFFSAYGVHSLNHPYTPAKMSNQLLKVSLISALQLVLPLPPPPQFLLYLLLLLLLLILILLFLLLILPLLLVLILLLLLLLLLQLLLLLLLLIIILLLYPLLLLLLLLDSELLSQWENHELLTIPAQTETQFQQSPNDTTENSIMK